MVYSQYKRLTRCSVTTDSNHRQHDFRAGFPMIKTSFLVKLAFSTTVTGGLGLVRMTMLQTLHPQINGITIVA